MYFALEMHLFGVRCIEWLGDALTNVSGIWPLRKSSKQCLSTDPGRHARDHEAAEEDLRRPTEGNAQPFEGDEEKGRWHEARDEPGDPEDDPFRGVDALPAKRQVLEDPGQAAATDQDDERLDRAWDAPLEIRRDEQPDNGDDETEPRSG